MRLVICDDDPVLREVVATLADHRGYEIAARTDNALDAIEAVRQGADVVILDLALPLMSGLDAIPRMLAVRPECRVLVLSAHDDQLKAALAAGAFAAFDKTNLLELDAVLQQCESAGPVPQA